MDAYTTALTLLSRRELSTTQLRDRLARRQFAPDGIEAVIRRLIDEGTLDDRRVAMTSARMDASIRRRGRRRVLQRIQQLGISGDMAKAAVEEVFGELDEVALLDQAIARRLKGAAVRTLDARGVARIVRSLVSQGFEAGQVYARLRKERAETDE